MARYTRRRTIDGLSAPAHALRYLVALVISLTTVAVAVPAAMPAAAQDSPGTGAIEVHVSECPPGYDGQDLYNQCHANGLTGVDVGISGPTSDTKTTEGGVGAARFANIPVGTYTIQADLPDEGQTYRTYCSLENSDTRVPLSPTNANPASLDVADGQAIVCDIHVVPPANGQPNPTPTTAPPADLASVTVNPVTCPDGTDPDAGFDVLSGACSGPAENVTFTWGNSGGTIETFNTSDNDPANGENGQVVIDGIAPGTYTLYSDVPLDAATEVLSCVADGGNRYQKDFSDNGVTTFSDIQREQIVCDWFIVPEAAAGPTQTPEVTPTPEGGRGDETGASLTVHLSLCPEEYTGDELYDTCHDDGIADQAFVLSGPDGDQSATTTVPTDPGPGLVEFTGLAAGDYTLSGGPPGDVGSVRLFCSTQPSGERIETSVDSTVASLAIADGEDVLCDWYYIPENARGETPTPTTTPERSRAEILVTLYACDPGQSTAGATYNDLSTTCDEPVDDVPFSLGAAGAPPLTANTGVSGAGAVRFYDLVPADYTLTPSLPGGMGSAAVYCQIDGGDLYQKTITSGSTTFADVDGESIACSWYATQPAPEPQQPAGPAGSITVREFLCEKDQADITDWEQECRAGSSGAAFTLTSADPGVELTSATDANGVTTFTSLPDGFYTLKQNDGIWCKAKAERVDSKSRLIVEGGRNTDVFLYQCAQVTDLPSTGTGPGISPAAEPAWWDRATGTEIALMGAGALGAMILVAWGISRRLSS